MLGGASIVPAFKRQETGPAAEKLAARAAGGPTYTWYEAWCAGYKSRYALAQLLPGEFTPLAMDLAPLQRTPAPIRRRTTVPFAMLPPAGARVVVLARGETGEALSHA